MYYKKDDLMKLLNKKVTVYFKKDVSGCEKLSGILYFVPYNSVDKYCNNLYINGHGTLVKENYFYINDLNRGGLYGFKVSHVKKVEVH